ncbi:MAG: glycosyl hydrolase family 18 protein [Thermaerobacter sp.]|nr:glycosyl hydrolase family 18 protein [Thermaerobacter sp.]
MLRSAQSVATAIAAVSLIAGCGTPAARNTVNNTVNSTRQAVNPVPSVSKGSPVKPPVHRKLRVIAFYDQTMSSVAPDPFTLVKAHPGLVDYLSPFWYEVTPTGAVTTKPEGNAAALARQDHLAVMPLFNNSGGNDAVLHQAATRTAAVKNIVSLVTKNQYAGVNIDFQLLKSSDRQDLTLFMQQLYQAMPNGKVISMSVVPLTSQNGQRSAYDYAALDKVLSAVVLMAYDLHGDGTAPGPVSPYAWVSQSISQAIKDGISPSKLYLGIANYGYLWTAGSTKATTIPLKVMYQHKYGSFTWNPTYKEAYDRYTSGGVSHIIWFVSDRAAADRIRLAEQNHLAGVAFWRIGYEDARWWNTVASAIGNGKATPATPAGVKHQHHWPPKTSPQHKKTS